MNHPRELLPDDPVDTERRRQLILEFWSALYEDGESGAATWEALDRLHERVTTALYRRPPDIGLAESLTAEAMLLIDGHGKT